MQNFKLNNRGYSIVEIVVALGILGVTVAAIIGFQSYINQQTQAVLQRSSFIKAINSISEDLVDRIETMPFRKNAVFYQAKSLDQTQLHASFDDTEAQSSCYDSEGRNVATDDGTCQFRVKYYRVQEIDRNYYGGAAFDNTSFAYLPLSRVMIQVKYLTKATASQAKPEERVIYLSRLKTNVLQY